ncbi:MAG: penicillin-binding transpeptidase domain-containing protein [Actinomycetota bacterium]|nr:penicillin-binding transpeptidase domain-containing protein [Actinomycetota bacterium]
MQRQIRKVGFGLVVAFMAVFFQLNYVQIFAAERIASNNANVRSLLREYSIARGDILTLDGTRVAVSEPTGDRLEYRRSYPGGALYGHITGYYSIRYGTSRIESAYNEQLLGDSGVISMQDIQDQFLGSGEEGDDVRLTIHSRLQEVARSALGDNEGAVVALDPQSGEVRAMWSNPSYDPTPLASHDGKEAKRYWESLNPDSPTGPLVSRVTSVGYPPGSTAKVVTAAAALESKYEPDSVFPDPVELELPQTDETLTNFTKTSCAGGQIDLRTALEVSCDTTFAMLGMEIPNEIRQMAEAIGFNEPIPFDVGTEPSNFPEVGEDAKPFQAYVGIGQGDVVATPLQMALVAATVANGGEVPRPQLVREVIDPSGGIVDRIQPESLGTAMSSETAREVTELMEAVVHGDNGTGQAAQIPGVTVAGKTGTAQTVEGENPHVWFIAFAPVEDPQLAVAVIVESGGTVGSEATGGAVAAPIAKQVLEADRQIREW